MGKSSILGLSQLTGKDRLTIRKRIDGLPYELKGKTKLYDNPTALEKIYCAPKADGGEFITAAEATRQLTIARKQQIELEMEVTRKERIPLDVIEQVNDRAFSNAAGILKAHKDKALTDEAINDILAELRNVGSALRHG